MSHNLLLALAVVSFDHFITFMAFKHTDTYDIQGYLFTLLRDSTSVSIHSISFARTSVDIVCACVHHSFGSG
jgi:hypothetical protein